MLGHPDEERPRGFLSAPLLALSVFFALGIVAAEAERTSLAETLRSVPFLLGLTGACMLAGLILARTRWSVLAGILALAGFALSGSVAARLFEFRFPPRHVSHLEDLGLDLRDPVRVSGRLVSSPLETPSGLQFDLEISEIEDRGRAYPRTGIVRLLLARGDQAKSVDFSESQQWLYGDTIRALAALQKPRVYRDPGVFDFRRWMASFQDVYWVGTIKSPLLVEKLPGQSPATVGELVACSRQALLRGIDRMYPPWSQEGRGGAVLKAVLLGDRSSLDSETIENFRKTGLYHLLVISGLHVGLIAMLASLLLRLTPLGEAWRSALVLLFLLGYCSLVEQRAPTTRAAIMIAAYLVGRFFYRQHAALNAVGLSALVLLMARPPWIFESGFELSFTAALLIVGLVVPILVRTTEPWRWALQNVNDAERDINFPPRPAQLRLDVRRMAVWLEERIAFLRNHLRAATFIVALPLRVAVWTLGTLLFTAILQIGLMLPLAAIFHRVTYAGIGLNALAIPTMTVVLALAVPTVLLSVVAPALAVWPAKLLALVMRVLFALTDLPHLPAWLSYRVPTPPAWVSLGFAISIIVAACSLGRNRRTFWISTASLVVFGASISVDPFPPQVPSGRLEVTALDCGSGDAFFVVLPDRNTMLIDAGGGRSGSRLDDPFAPRRWNAGEEIVSPYLWSRQFKKIDVVVMSRGDEGRLPGFAAIARNFSVEEFWCPASGLAPAALSFLDELERRGIHLRTVRSGEPISRGSTSIQTLWPPPAASGTSVTPTRNGSGEAANAQAAAGGGLLIRIQDREGSVLFASDIGGRAQQDLLNAHARLGAPVLALPDLESSVSLSRDFALSISPRAVLAGGVAEGRKDSSLSSTPSVFRFSGSRFFRTGRDGAVTVEMQGRTVSVRAYGMPAGDGMPGLASTASFTSSSLKVR